MTLKELICKIFNKETNILTEELNIGSYDSNGGKWEVEVYDNEGNYPHVHVTTPKGEVSAPRLDIVGYFIHEGKKYVLNSNEKKDFNNFMNDTSKYDSSKTNWQFAVDIWNRNKSVKISNAKEIMPNYRLLPSLIGNRKRKLKKY